MHTRASNSELVEPLPEPERTLNRRLHRRNRRFPYDQRNNPPHNPIIVYPPILDINYFRHFLDFLRNYDPMDDEPMWAVDRVVAPTPGFAITIPETANEFAIQGTIETWDELRTTFIGRFFPLALFDRLLGEIRAFSQHENESLTDAWLRMKKMLRNCHGHNLSEGNIIKIFYHGLSKITQEVLNATARGIFIYKTPNQAYQLLKDKVLLKLDRAKNQKTKSPLKKTVAFVDEGTSNSDTNKIIARMDAMTIKMDAQYKELQSCAKQTTPNLNEDDIPISREEEAKFMPTFRKTRFYNDYRDRDSNRDNWLSSGHNDYNRDNYRSNTDGPQTLLSAINQRFCQRNIHEPQNSARNSSNSKAYEPPQSHNEHVNAVFIRSGKFYNPPDNPNNQQNNSENPINFDRDDEDNEPTPQPRTQPAKPVKETPLLKPYKPKIPYPQRLRKEKMEAQYGKFLYRIRAIRINVPLVNVLAGMPNYEKFLKEFISNKHKIKQIIAAFLSDESSAMIQNKVPLKLRDPGSFLIPCDFKTFSCNALADLVRIERMIFNIDSAMKHSYSNDDTCFSIDVIDEFLEEDFDALLDEGSKILHSIKGTLLEEEIFFEFDEFMAMTTDENSKSESNTDEPPFEKITINTDYKIKS
uniref:Retrotransposon gag domain-containing protein n=1 Tax=Tanacetum cinerariifolium TaxID=118510 RepID=A0A6L2P9C6_TANCI|nr:hypothetical protein [Tanacetum cinerariifolium]